MAGRGLAASRFQALGGQRICRGLSAAGVLVLTGCASIIGADEGTLGDPNADAGITEGAAGVAGAAGEAGAAGASGVMGAAGAAGAGAAAGTGGMSGANGANGAAGADTCGSGILGEGPQGPSCSGLSATCGGDGNESCCRNLLVPGNSPGAGCEGKPFFRDNDAAPGQYDSNSHAATIDDFHLDRFEVSIGRFKKFVGAYDNWIKDHHPAEGEGAHPKIPGSGWLKDWKLPGKASDFWGTNPGHGTAGTISQYSLDDHLPVGYMGWYLAFAFCLWDGGRLPTEAEWMYAASGGSEQRAYPWSNPASSVSISGDNASYYTGSDCTGDGQNNGCSVTDLIKVGTRKAGYGRWGHTEMGGNLWEWTFDAHQDSYPEPCANCATTGGAPLRVVRGGSLLSTSENLRSALRFKYDATHYDQVVVIGFRCAR